MSMKKILQLLVIACMVVLGTQVAFANVDKSTVIKDADLTGIHRLAIGSPLYLQVSEKAPDKSQLTQIIYDASRVSNAVVVSYDTVADGVKNVKSIDMKALPRREGAKVFKENVVDYADAYVILTVANNSFTEFFFDVYKAGSNDLLYSYAIAANRHEEDSADAFLTMSEQFFKNLDREITQQEKKKK